MTKKPEFLGCEGECQPDSAFLLEYQKAVLLALQTQGLLDVGQVQDCMERLEQENL